MPPRKEPKEQVVYPSSKRKVPAFKPLKPNKVPRIPTTESESSVTSKPAASKLAGKKDVSRANKKAVADLESDDGSDDDTKGHSEDESRATSTSGFRLAAKALKPTVPTKRKASIVSISSRDGDMGDLPDTNAGASKATEDPMPTQSDDVPSIPQPLLLRLVHESFADKHTKIDKHAMQVFQKYIEVFVREAIARCALDKKDAAARGECGEMDAEWLELEDLERAAPALMLDF